MTRQAGLASRLYPWELVTENPGSSMVVPTVYHVPSGSRPISLSHIYIYIYIHTTEAIKVYDKVKKKELRQPKVTFDDLGKRRTLSHRRYTEM
jgi:hypothetical protein